MRSIWTPIGKSHHGRSVRRHVYRSTPNSRLIDVPLLFDSKGFSSVPLPGVFGDLKPVECLVMITDDKEIRHTFFIAFTRRQTFPDNAPLLAATGIPWKAIVVIVPVGVEGDLINARPKDTQWMTEAIRRLALHCGATGYVRKHKSLVFE